MPTKEQVDRLVALQELERRGELPPEYQSALDELRNRGVVPPISPGPASDSAMENYVAGIGQGMSSVGRGLGQVTGLVSQEEIDEAKRLDAPLLDTGAGLAGSLTGAVASTLPAAAIPGVGTYPGAIAAGGLIGGLGPVASDESRTRNTLLGAAGGGAGRAAVGGLSRLLSPRPSDAVQRMIDEGVELTPGRLGGPMLAGLESRATSVPGAGHMIESAMRGNVESFNRAVINKVLAPIGAQVDDVGRGGVKMARDMIGEAYQNATKGLTGSIDDQFRADLGDIITAADDLPTERSEQLTRILKNRLVSKFGADETMSGKTFKAVDSDLGEVAAKYMASGDAEQRMLGEAVRDAQTALREMLARANPERAAAIRAADEAYAGLVRLENAANRGQGGVFTPSQFKQAIKATERTRRKSRFARGESMFQDFAEAAEEAMPITPSSGSIERGIVGAGLLTAGAVEPATLAGVGGLGALYTPYMQSLLRGSMTMRPEIARRAGGLLAGQGPRSGIAGASALPYYFESP